jgi:ABC-type phosphate/phosphonate transport system permease subunit
VNNEEPMGRREHGSDAMTNLRRSSLRMPPDSILYEKVVPALLVLLGIAFVAVILGIVVGLVTGVLTLH